MCNYSRTVAIVRLGLVAASLLLIPSTGLCAVGTQEQGFTIDADNLFDLSLEELMDIEVTSVTRCKGQDVFTSPAAIYVITQEDIRRSGHRSIPELLRMVPGVQVSRIRADQWTISIRGFAEHFANKLLVQIDGRTIYNNVFSGVLWESQDYILEDIERIEVIRGPGAALWGANAVTGIINIITKKAKDTQGGLFTAGGGNTDAISQLRYGGKAGENGFYRVYGKYRTTNEFPSSGFSDEWDFYQTGFRYDWQEQEEDSFTLTGDIHKGRYSLLFPNINLAAGTNNLRDLAQYQTGWNILGIWEHIIDDSSSTRLTAYYDKLSFTIPHKSVDFRADSDLFEIDFQHNINFSNDNSFVWGLGYKRNHITTRSSDKLAFDPTTRNLDFIHGFLQYSFKPFSEKYKLIVGTKLEHNDFTGFEYQPSAKLVYKADDRTVFWGGYSRALRRPSTINQNINFVAAAIAPMTAVRIIGNRDAKSERVNSYEVGMRLRPNNKLSIDATGFVNHYDRLQQIVQQSALTSVFANEQSGSTHGIEVAVDWEVRNDWRLKGTYSWFRMKLEGNNINLEGNTPNNMFSLLSYHNITDDLELNMAAYFQDEMDGSGAIANVDSWVRFDAGLVWRIKKNLEFGIWGQNLLDSGHLEAEPEGFINVGASEIPRSVFFQMKYIF